MAKKKNKVTRKQLLNEPDEILSVTRKTFNWVIENKGYVSVALGVVFAAVLIYSGINYFADRAERRAFSELQETMERYRDVRKGDDQAEEVAKKAYEAVRGDMTVLIQEYSGRTGAKMARIELAGMAYDAGDYETAVKLYEKSLEDVGSYPSLKNLVIGGLAYALAGKEDYADAIANFEKIASGDDPVMKEDALFNLGRIYETTGNLEKSKTAFEQLTADFPNSVYAGFAKEKLAGMPS